MSKKVTTSEYPLIIEVTKTFPLRRIKEVFVKRPEASYGDSVKLTSEEARYLLESLNTIISPKAKNIAWVEEDRSGTPHLMLGSSAGYMHEPKLCPECIEPNSLKKYRETE